MEFFRDLLDPNLAFLRYALLAGLLASVSCGVVGSYVVVRRISYIAGGIAHCVLGGIGAARYMQVKFGWEFLDPLYGAVAAALVSACVIGWVSLHAREREDTVIGAIWSVGMAVGVLFMARTPGYGSDLMSYLFGNILVVTPQSLVILLILDAVVLGAALLFYNQFLAACFDEEFARLRGVRVEAFYLLLLCLIALTVVVLQAIVGVVLVIALLTLPAAIAGRCSKTLWRMMILAGIACAALTTGGIALSYSPKLPPGATIAALAGAAYLAVLIGARLWRKRAPRG